MNFIFESFSFRFPAFDRKEKKVEKRERRFSQKNVAFLKEIRNIFFLDLKEIFIKFKSIGLDFFQMAQINLNEFKRNHDSFFQSMKFQTISKIKFWRYFLVGIFVFQKGGLKKMKTWRFLLSR